MLMYGAARCERQAASGTTPRETAVEPLTAICYALRMPLPETYARIRESIVKRGLGWRPCAFQPECSLSPTTQQRLDPYEAASASPRHLCHSQARS